ncbi:MAG: acetate--CoA ligase family protein [Bacillota bacterium]
MELISVDGWDALFYPSSIAVVGASGDRKKPGGIVLSNLEAGGFAGEVYPVNPGHKELDGRRCYPDLMSIPGPVDAAVIAVKSPLVMSALGECAQKGVRAAIIFSSGFGEVDETGLELQQQIRDLAVRHNIRVCGPNTMGLINYLHNMQAAFVYGYTLPGWTESDDGGIALICQSGGVGCSMLQACAENGLGVAAYVCTGNEAVTGFSDYLAYFINNPRVKIIASYMEGVRDGEKLGRAADLALAAGKPVVVLKTGNYEASARAARSHTGALAGSGEVYRSFFRQKGIIEAAGISEMAALLSLLSTGRRPGGRRVAVLASSGGQAVIAADKFSGAGFELAQLSEDTRQKLAKHLPSYAGTANPVDFTGLDIVYPGLLQECGVAVAEDQGVDTLVISHWLNEEVASLEQIKGIASRTGKPLVILGSIPGQTPGAAAPELIRQGAAYIGEIDVAATSLARVAAYAEKALKSTSGREVDTPVIPREVIERCRSLGPGTVLAEREAKEILAACGIRVVPEVPASTAEEAVAVSQRLGYPVVLKVDSPDIVHKTEVDGIRINLERPEDVRRAFSDITGQAALRRPGAAIRGVLVQKMLGGGREILVGISRDPVFGPVLTFGMGGIWVEILKDVSLRVLPVNRDEISEMIRETKFYSLLAGARGKAAADLEAVVDTMCRVAELAARWPELAELDINPLIVLPGGMGAWVVDAMAVVGEGAGNIAAGFSAGKDSFLEQFPNPAFGS